MTPHAIRALQTMLKEAGYDPGPIDGAWGGRTAAALARWQDARAASEPVRAPSRWPSQATMTAFYGSPGSAACTAGRARLPFAFPLAWDLDQRIMSFACHAKCADAFTAIFAQAAAHYGEAEFRRLRLDRFGGCYNYRPVRGGTAMSTHAWGAAVDLDPERNQLRWGRDKSALAGPEYDAFWRIVEAQGAVSLGRARNYDWMHFQFATL